jgi:hypothetical protein
MHLFLRAIFWNQRSFRGVLPHGALTRVSIVCESRYFHWVAGSQTSGRQTSLSQHSCMQLQSLSGVSTEPQAMFQGRSSEPVAVSTWTLPSATSSSSQYLRLSSSDQPFRSVLVMAFCAAPQRSLHTQWPHKCKQWWPVTWEIHEPHRQILTMPSN